MGIHQIVTLKYQRYYKWIMKIDVRFEMVNDLLQNVVVIIVIN